MDKDIYFEMDKRMIKKPSKKHYLTRIGKLTLYGPIISALAAGTLKVAGDYKISKFEEQNEIDSAISECEIIAHDTDVLTVSKIDQDGMFSYNFNVEALLTNLKNSTDYYNKYNSELFHSKLDQANYDMAMNTILYSNDKLIEIYNEMVKRCIARQTCSNSKDIDIFYNSPYEGADPEIKVSINGEKVRIGKDLEDIIIQYKEGLLFTYDLNYKGLPKNIKESYVRKVIDNIPNMRKAIKQLYAADTRFVVGLQHKSQQQEEDALQIENQETTFFTKTSPYKVDFLNVTVLKNQKTPSSESQDER